MNIEVKEVELAEQPAIAIRETLPVDQLPAFFGRAFGTLMAYAGEHGAGFAGPPFAQYYSVEPQAVDVEAAFPLTQVVEGEGEVHALTLAAGEAAEVLYRGPYSGMEAVYGELFQWIAQHGKRPAGPCREVYLNEPGAVAESELETLIIQPIAG